MILKISHVRNAGDVANERLVLRATEDGEAGEYFVLCTHKSEGAEEPLSGPPIAGYWLPDGAVKQGDLIVLYTKGGSASTKQNKSGSTSSFYYFNEAEPLWRSDRMAVLLRSPVFQYFDAIESKTGDDVEPAQSSPNEL